MAWSPEKVETTVEALVKRATTDADFRRRALQDPAAAVKEVAGEAPPADFTLRLVDNAGAALTLVLPDLRDGELSDEQLESVAGGSTKVSNGTQKSQPSYADPQGGKCYVGADVGC